MRPWHGNVIGTGTKYQMRKAALDMDDDEIKPEDIECGEQVFDIAFHPRDRFIATGLIDGAVKLYNYNVLNENGGNREVMSLNHHQKACRGLQFNDSGDRLFTVSSDKSLQIIDGTGNVILNIEDAHEEAINKCYGLYELGPDILATGDDSGCVKIWDTRLAMNTKAAVMNWQIHQDYIAGFAYSHDKQTLLSCSGDATLGVYDIRNNTTAISDDQESEITSLEIIKGGKKVVCGTQDGVVLIFSWGKWGDCTDRFPGHPEGIETFLKIDESTIMTGSTDGLIRVVEIQPNKVLGIVGDHDNFPVECIRASGDRRYLASIAHDDVVRFWNIDMFNEVNTDKGGAFSDEEEAGGADEEGEMVDEEAGNDDDGDDGDDGDDDDDDDDVEMSEDSRFSDDSSDDEEQGKGSSRTLKTATEKFYSDL